MNFIPVSPEAPSLATQAFVINGVHFVSFEYILDTFRIEKSTKYILEKLVQYQPFEEFSRSEFFYILEKSNAPDFLVTAMQEMGVTELYIVQLAGLSDFYDLFYGVLYPESVLVDPDRGILDDILLKIVFNPVSSPCTKAEAIVELLSILKEQLKGVGNALEALGLTKESMSVFNSYTGEKRHLH